MINIFYLHSFNVIGGLETFMYEIAKKYAKDYDITFIYRDGSEEQVDRIRKLARVIKWDGKRRFKCKKVFFGVSSDIAPYVEADEYWMMLHADYRYQKIKLQKGLPEGTKFLSVTEHVAEGAKEWLGVDAIVCHNPLTIERPKKLLRLVSATRLTVEKGRDRMVTLAKALDDAGIPFTWEIFTNDIRPFESPNIVLRKPRLDITPFIAAADYLVQLSDTEAFSYSINEAIVLGVPVIVTDMPMIKDAGIKDGVHGFVLPFDMSEIPIEKIYNGLPPFTYKPIKDGYAALLAKGKSDYQKRMQEPVRVRTTMYYTDLHLNRLMNPGEEQTVTRERAEALEDRGLVEIIDDPSI